jgi:hypothetical protein
MLTGYVVEELARAMVREMLEQAERDRLARRAGAEARTRRPWRIASSLDAVRRLARVGGAS